MQCEDLSIPLYKWEIIHKCFTFAQISAHKTGHLGPFLLTGTVALQQWTCLPRRTKYIQMLVFDQDSPSWVIHPWRDSGWLQVWGYSHTCSTHSSTSHFPMSGNGIVLFASNSADRIASDHRSDYRAYSVVSKAGCLYLVLPCIHGLQLICITIH